MPDWWSESGPLATVLFSFDINEPADYHSRMSAFPWARCVLWVPALLVLVQPSPAETCRIATYNLENYVLEPTQTRAVKSPEARAKVRESIRVLKPDVLALQEVGSFSALEELRSSLSREGLEFPHWELLSGADTNGHVAILSRFPFTARRPHTNENFLLSGRRFQVSRGFGEVDVQVSPRYTFTLIAAHLKSKRALSMADEAELRLEEAKLLRQHVDERLAANPTANVVVLGDFNDTKDSSSTRAVIGKYKQKLVDTQPAEREGDDFRAPASEAEPRKVTWTHYYAKEDSYARIDFILLSPGMAREWVARESYVLSLPGWGLASDHRPVVVTVEAEDK
jgi:endonuclease/exonuclease/phosphatase family metal-dependent hydrolase